MYISSSDPLPYQRITDKLTRRVPPSPTSSSDSKSVTGVDEAHWLLYISSRPRHRRYARCRGLRKKRCPSDIPRPAPLPYPPTLTENSCQLTPGQLTGFFLSVSPNTIRLSLIGAINTILINSYNMNLEIVVMKSSACGRYSSYMF